MTARGSQGVADVAPMCLPTTINHSAYRGQPTASSWETISLLAANPWIINFDISLKGGGIISYLGLDTIFLSDLNLEMWSDRSGTRGGRRRRADMGRLVGQMNKARGIRVIPKRRQTGDLGARGTSGGFRAK